MLFRSKIESSDVNEPKKEVEENKTKKVKITEFIPKFVGTDLNEYGPFDINDIADLPSDVAELLVDKGSADEQY